MPSIYQPGHLVTLQEYHCVYELLDDHGLVFYVGVTKDPPRRLRCHLVQPHSREVAALLLECSVPTLRIVSVHLNRAEAELAEAARIKATPGVLNEVGFGRDPAVAKAKRRRKHLRREAKRKALRDWVSG